MNLLRHTNTMALSEERDGSSGATLLMLKGNQGHFIHNNKILLT